MEFRQLEIFRAVAQELNFTRAAERVHTVQSNVTTQIRALEQEVGVPLFDRLGKQVRLTQAGQKFLHYVERILSLADAARHAATGVEKPKGTLNITSSDSVLTYRLPPFLQKFRKKYPDIELSFPPGLSGTLRTQLQTGVVDAAFVIDNRIDDPQLHIEPLTIEAMTFIASPDHPLAKKERFLPAELKAQTLLLTEPRCAYRVKFEQILARARVAPAGVMGFGTIEAVKACAILGMGIGLLPHMVVEADLRSGRLAALRIAREEITMMTQLIWHKDKWMSPAFQLFVNEARECLNCLSTPQRIRKAG